MDTKLTLKLDDNIIDRAKDYARQKNVSLSKLIESYLNILTASKTDKSAVTPLVKSISGIIKLSGDFDYKKNYKNYLAGKYSKY